jgi:putative transposase
MGNHQHLFVKTPLANLDRCMRHLNGLYTQCYNRFKKTEGPLFRGQYKAILVEADAYAHGLQLSRWSSYPCYINKTERPSWLYCDLVYDY